MWFDQEPSHDHHDHHDHHRPQTAPSFGAFPVGEPQLVLINTFQWHQAYIDYRRVALDVFGITGMDTSHDCSNQAADHGCKYARLLIPQHQGFICLRSGIAHECRANSSSNADHPYVETVHGDYICPVSGAIVGKEEYPDKLVDFLDADARMGGYISLENAAMLSARADSKSRHGPSKYSIEKGPGSGPIISNVEKEAMTKKKVADYARAKQRMAAAQVSSVVSGDSGGRLTRAARREFSHRAADAEHLIHGALAHSVFDADIIHRTENRPFCCKTPLASEALLVECLASKAVLADYFWEDLLLDHGAVSYQDGTSEDRFSNHWSAAVSEFKSVIDSIWAAKNPGCSAAPDSGGVLAANRPSVASSTDPQERGVLKSSKRTIEQPKQDGLSQFTVRLNTDLALMKTHSEKYFQVVIDMTLHGLHFTDRHSVLRKTCLYLILVTELLETRRGPGNDGGESMWMSKMRTLLEASSEEKSVAALIEYRKTSIQSLIARICAAFSAKSKTNPEEYKHAAFAFSSVIEAYNKTRHVGAVHPAILHQWTQEMKMEAQTHPERYSGAVIIRNIKSAGGDAKAVGKTPRLDPDPEQDLRIPPAKRAKVTETTSRTGTERTQRKSKHISLHQLVQTATSAAPAEASPSDLLAASQIAPGT